jgi:(p)ppGpp synthase/HD superfamily hydrolase
MKTLRNNDTSKRRTRRLGAAAMVGTVAFALAQQMTPAAAFTAISQQTSTITSHLYFRNHLADDTILADPTTSLPNPNSFLTPPSPSSSSSPVNIPATTEQQPEQDLPTWLSTPQGHLAEANLKALLTATRASFFTETESLKLLYAIEVAAGNSRNLVAGAADFCLMLVDCMEMGLNALVAAAFHYCSCVKARESPDAGYSFDSAVESFGTHAELIFRDAGKLKRLEVVAASVMLAGHKARVTPDSRDAENLRKLLLSETKDWRALAIRSAACLYRLKGLRAADSDLTPEAVRVSREALFIYAPLASRLGMHRLKNELENAAFCQLYRRQYEMVQAQSTLDDSNINQSMTQALLTVQTDMTTMLEQDAEFMSLMDNFSVTARVKEPYSMWKKMLRDGYHNILQVPDALALRIVLNAKKLSPDEPSSVTRARERALCYYAQKLFIGQWQPNASNPRFKDYIESPKANGYQSLHYTAKTESSGQEWTIEIQVRSGEMNQVAEYGLASHWDYKAFTKEKSSENRQSYDVKILKDQSSDAYLRAVQEWHWQQHGQQQAEKAKQLDSSPASFEPVVLSDIWQSRVRADRIRARTQRLAPYIEALTMAQSDLARESVIVFVTQSHHSTPSEGKVLALPAGACVLDAIRLGANMDFRWSDKDLDLNGAATSLTRQLHNGDVLTIPLPIIATPTTAV